MKRILTLTDFSNVASHATEAAIRFAKQYGAELKIYHVMSDKDLIQYKLEEEPEINLVNRRNEQVQAKLESWRDKAISEGVSVNLTVGEGDLFHGLKELLKQQDFDMIIMGSTGIDKNDGIWGTTTQKVIRKVDIPVLVIKSEMRDYKLDNILFASNLNVEDQKSLTKTLDLIKPPADSVIHLMSVDTSSFFTQPWALMIPVLKEFEKLVEPYKSDSIFYKDYSVNSGIRHYLENVDPDVLIMTNRKRHPIKDLFIPNSAMDAVGHLDCPVLIVK